MKFARETNRLGLSTNSVEKDPAIRERKDAADRVGGTLRDYELPWTATVRGFPTWSAR